MAFPGWSTSGETACGVDRKFAEAGLLGVVQPIDLTTTGVNKTSGESRQVAAEFSGAMMIVIPRMTQYDAVTYFPCRA